MKLSNKFICILERPYDKESDCLIAGHFTDSDDCSFGIPFLMVEKKSLLLSELYLKLQDKFKGKKINKFQDSD